MACDPRSIRISLGEASTPQWVYRVATQVRGGEWSNILCEGFRWRWAALAIVLLFVSVTSYPALVDPSTLGPAGRSHANPTEGCIARETRFTHPRGMRVVHARVSGTPGVLGCSRRPALLWRQRERRLLPNASVIDHLVGFNWWYHADTSPLVSRLWFHCCFSEKS